MRPTSLELRNFTSYDLYHITLTTGQVRHSPRGEVSEEVVAQLRALLPRALAGEHVPLPAPGPGYTITGGVHGRCCAVTIWHAIAADHHVPLLTTGIAPHSRCGTRLWQHLHDTAATPLQTRRDHVPPEPWCADRIEVGVVLDPEAMHWTGDYSRCIAWAWIELRAG